VYSIIRIFYRMSNTLFSLLKLFQTGWLVHAVFYLLSGLHSKLPYSPRAVITYAMPGETIINKLTPARLSQNLP
jgi:hypothetical protein